MFFIVFHSDIVSFPVFLITLIMFSNILFVLLQADLSVIFGSIRIKSPSGQTENLFSYNGLVKPIIRVSEKGSIVAIKQQ